MIGREKRVLLRHYLVLCSQSLFRFADLGMMDCAEAVQTRVWGRRSM